MAPSKPDVTKQFSLYENSMFFTQFEWPLRVRRRLFRYLGPIR
jgi:hypothetical protein